MTGAVHRAIASPAVLAQFFSQLSPGWNQFEDPDNADYEEERENRSSLRGALAACARVCRAFSGPALDAQWKVLDDVSVLLKILPHTLTDPDDDSGPEMDKDTNTYNLDVLTLSSGIDDMGWARFREFTQRVRELNACPPCCFIHPTVWTTLATRLQGTPLLPHLRRLHMDMIYKDPTAFVLCLSPALRELSFDAVDEGGRPMPMHSEFVENIVTIISATEELPLSSYRYLQLEPLALECTEVIAQHLRSIGRLSHLEIVNLVPAAGRITLPALRALATFSSLHTLRLVVPRTDVDKDAPLSLEGLATVQRLHLSGDVEGMRRVMAAIPPSGIRHLYLRISGSQHKEIERAFGAMKHCIPPELEFFECVFFGPIADSARPLLRLFHAFLKFSSLKYFAVHMMMGHGIHLSDSDLRVFGASWPALERFAMVSWELPGFSKPGARQHGRPTVAGLIELAKACPRLHLIRVPGLDVGTLPAADEMLEHGHEWLRYLDPHVLVNDQKADLGEVTRVLDDLFPGLVDIPEKYIKYNATKESVSWDKVQALMQARRAARREAASDGAHGDLNSH